MDGVAILPIIITALAVFARLSWTHGVDTRPGFEDPRGPLGDLSI